MLPFTSCLSVLILFIQTKAVLTLERMYKQCMEMTEKQHPIVVVTFINMYHLLQSPLMLLFC